METKFCPRHDHVIQNLMLGLLEDSQARDAEDLLRDCPECASAYDHFFSGTNFEEVQKGVSEGLATWTPPSNLKKRHWMRLTAMAAAATLVLAGGLHWAKLHPHSFLSFGNSVPKTIARIDFEQPNTGLQNGVNIRISPEKTAPEKTSTTAESKAKGKIFSDGAEAGNLKGWSLHT